MANKYYWLNRTIFGTAFLVVFMSGWYILRNHNQVTSGTPAADQTASTSPVIVKNAVPTSSVAPTIEQVAGQIQLSVDTRAYKKVQRVEFYVENQLVGAAYSAPYKVSIDQNNVSAGTHSVIAKVFMEDTTAQTTAASFTNSAASAPAATPSDETVPASTVSASPQPTSTPSQATPGNVSAAISPASDTTAVVSWTAPAGASSYQVWRDGSQIATTSSTSYEDANLISGQTYNYQVVAVANSGTASDASDIAAVTMPAARTYSAENTPQSQPAAQSSSSPADTSGQ